MKIHLLVKHNYLTLFKNVIDLDALSEKIL